MTPMNPIASVLLALVLPQTPTSRDGQDQPTPSAVIAHANAFPDSTLACASIAVTREQVDALTQTPMVKAVIAELTERGATTATITDALVAATGVPLPQWLGLLHHGVTVGITAIEDDGQVRWLAIADAQEQATSFAVMLDRLRQAPGVTSMAAEDGTARTWTWTTSRGRAAFAIHDNKIVAGDSSTTVGQALERLRQTQPAHSLASTPGFVDFELAASVQTDRLAAAWVRPSLLAERLVSDTTDPREGTPRVQGVLRALDITRIQGVGLTVIRDGEGFVETLHVDWPSPRNGLLAEFLAPKATLRPEVAALVPPEVDSFSASTVDLQRLYHGAIRLLTEVAPSLARGVQGQVTQFGDTAGVNLQDDLIGKVGNQVVTLLWNSDAEPSSAYIIALQDAAQFDRTLRRTVAALGTVHEQSVNGYRTLVLDSGDAQVSLAVTEDSLVLATSAAAMQRTLDQIAAPRGAESAVQIPAGVSAYGVAKLTSLLGQVGQTMDTAVARTGSSIDTTFVTVGIGALRRAITAASTMVTSAARDDRIVTLSVQSPFGGIVTPAFVVATFAAAPNIMRWGADSAAVSKPGDSLPSVLTRIAAAEREYQTTHEGAASAGLHVLVEAGLLTASDLGDTADGPVCARDGYRLTLLWDGDTAASFIAVAWPDGARTGPVFAATTDHPTLINDVMAQAKGLTTVELADIYTSGFGSPMRSGWRVAPASPVAATTAPTTTESAPPGGRLASAVARLTKGEGNASDDKERVHTALTGTDPVAIAYAAHAVGRLRLTDEVPTLVTLAAKHDDLAVRTQAMWALLQLGDPRSKQTAIQALASDSVELRALAAANLGKLRAAEGSSALLGILSKGTGSADDERDRALALLALADIGDPAPLLQAAAAVHDGTAHTVQALTFLLQTLSPKLSPKEEATTLVAVLDHPQSLVRRYVIQRLGELREPSTVRALEDRLGQETRELLPLVQVSLQAVQHNATDPNQQPWTETLKGFGLKAQTTWNNLTPNHRYAAFGIAIALVAAMFLVGVLRRRTRTHAQGQAWATMAATTSSGQYRPRDEVEMPVGESGVYSAHDHEDDAVLESTIEESEEFVAPRR